jgi:hypothetical protein
MSSSSDSAVFNIAGSNYLQFNNSVTDKGNRIGYNLANTGSSGMLDIIGNGSASSRSIKLWDTVTVNNGLTVSAGNLNVDEGVLYSGSKNTGGIGGGLNIYNKSSDTTASITAAGAIKGLTVESTQTITAGTGLTVTTGNLTISAGVLNSGSKLTGGVGGELNIYNGTNNTTASISSAGAITCSSLSARTGGITTTGDITTTSEGKITSAKLLTASDGFTATNGTVNITATTINVPTKLTSESSISAASTEFVNNYVSEKTTFIPTGSIISYMGASDPVGWVICNGVARVYNSKYDNLIAMSIGIKNTTNNTYTPPDLINKFLYGSNTAGNTGGSSTATLTTANMPAHTHGMDHMHFIPSNFNTESYSSLISGNNNYYGRHIHNSLFNGNFGFGNTGANYKVDSLFTGQPTTDPEGAAPTRTNTDSNGSGNSFSILPSYYSVKYIIRL